MLSAVRTLTSLNTLALANTKIDKKFERLTPVSKEEFDEVSGWKSKFSTVQTDFDKIIDVGRT